MRGHETYGRDRDTETLAIKVYRDAMTNQNSGGSSAQSAVLATLAVAATATHFPSMGHRINA